MSTPHEITLTRVVQAPRESVYQAFTDPAQLAAWWGPHGFTAPTCRADARPGGELYIEMAGPAGSPWAEPYPMWGEFVELHKPEKVVFTALLKNPDGSTFLENRNTIVLSEADGQTTLMLHVEVLNASPGSEAPLSGMVEGWNQSLEKLETLVIRG